MTIKPLLICTVGLPHSGKTAWALQQNIPIVSRDAIRLNLCGQRFSSEAEPMVKTFMEYMVGALFLGSSKSVIVVECNILKERRDTWYSDQWNTVFQYFDTSKEECIRRAESENDTVIIPVIERMAAEIDYVPMIKTFDKFIAENEHTSLISLSERQYIQAMWELCPDFWTNPVVFVELPSNIKNEYLRPGGIISTNQHEIVLREPIPADLALEYRGVKIKLQEEK